jgi:hypothetical protein
MAYREGPIDIVPVLPATGPLLPAGPKVLRASRYNSPFWAKDPWQSGHRFFRCCPQDYLWVGRLSKVDLLSAWVERQSINTITLQRLMKCSHDGPPSKAGS